MLEDAWKALQKAWQDLENYRSTKDHMILRDAAEKGWLAVNEAVEALLKHTASRLKHIRRREIIF